MKHFIIQIHKKMKDFYNDFFVLNNNESLKFIEILDENKSLNYIKNYTYSLSQKLKNEDIDTNTYKFKVYINKKIYKSLHECLIVCFIDIDTIYNLIKNGKSIPNRKLFFNILQIHFFNMNIKKQNFNFLNNIPLKEYELSQWDELNFSKYFNNIFYNYQKKNILWMLDNECNGIINIKHFNKNIFKLYNDVYVDMYHSRFLFASDIDTINFRGGILFDEPGLGKSLCSLAISELNKQVDFNTDFKIKSEATLIITSNDMFSHWKFLIKTFIKKKRNIISIISKRDFDKYTYNDILNADYVIFSINLIISKVFIDKIKEYQNTSNAFNEIEHALETILIENERNNNILNENHIFPFIVYWKRIIFDKVIERSYELKYSDIYKILYSFKSYYKWIIEDDIKDIKYFKETMCLLSNNNINFNENIFSLNDNLNTFLRKNLTSNVKSQLKIKDIKRVYNYIPFNYYEKRIDEYFPNYFNVVFNSEFPSFELIDKINNFNIINKDDYIKILTNEDYKNNLIKNFDENNFDCNICYDTYQKNDIRFYTCGHFNCFKCIDTLLKNSNNIKCPNCRNNLNKNNIYKLENLIDDKINSKILYLIQLIPTLKNKIILLSYNDKHFDYIKLKLNHITNVHSCKGSYFQKNFIMKRFDTSNEKSLLLCTYHSSETLQKINIENIDIIYLSPLNINDVFYKHKFLLLNNILHYENTSHYYLYYENSIEKKYIYEIKEKFNNNDVNINSMII
jgi:hypothetical protein